MAALDKLEELNLTQDEIKRFSDAMQKPEFKELLFEYAKEISDPENRARYEMEIREMENERGMDVKFVNPEPGYVIKTTIGGNRKAFINVCKNQHIGKPSSTKQTGNDGRPGLCWSLPHSFTPPRDDVSKTGVRCTVFDFVVHPDTYRMAETNPRFKCMVNDTAFEGIKKMFDVDVDTKNLKFPKLKYKGNPTSSVIRVKLAESGQTINQDDLSGKFAYPYDSKTSEEKAKEIMEHNAKVQASRTKKEKKENKHPAAENEFIVPKYIIKYQSNLDIQNFMNTTDARNATLPKNLIIEVDLPLLQSANPISLDVFEKRLSLVSDKPFNYRLDIDLAYPVDENEGSAKFDKHTRKLIVTLPVVPDENIPKLPFAGESFTEDTNRDELEDNQGEREGNGMESMCKTEQVRPLIEVISEKELEADVKKSYAATNGEQSSLAAANNLHHEYDSLTHNIVYLLPDFECHQDDTSLLFTFDTKKVRKESLLLTVLSQNAISVKMISVGSGGFPVYYSCFLKFEDDFSMDMNNCQISFSEKEGVSLLVTKDVRSTGQWKSCSVGVNMTQLQQRDLEMKTPLISTDSAESSSEVIELDVKNVIYQNPVMGSESVKPEIISVEMEVSTVHEQGSSELHEILLQYEPIETSDSAPTVHGRTRSNTFGSEAEDLADCLIGASPSSLKKSVSFNEPVDRMVLENQMQASLKNEQKNVRTCEKRQQLNHAQRNGIDPVGSDEDQPDSNKNESYMLSDSALLASQSDEIQSVLVSRNYNAGPWDRSSVRKDSEADVRNNSSSEEIYVGPVGKINSDGSAEKGESHDCKTTFEEDNESPISQLNASAQNGALTETPPEDLKPAAMSQLSKNQTSTLPSVNIERKLNSTTVEIKNKFVFDLDVD